MTRQTVVITLSHEDVQLARANAFKKSPTTRNPAMAVQEMAALAGSRYLMGGTSTYRVLSRDMGSKLDMPGANVSFFGEQVSTPEDIWKLNIEIRSADRRKGWVYIPVGVSPVRNSGTEDKPLFQAFAMIIGYKEEEDNISGILRFAALETAPPFPIRWKRNGGKQDVQWPIGSRG